jgi:hypothetical protein
LVKKHSTSSLSNVFFKSAKAANDLRVNMTTPNQSIQDIYNAVLGDDEVDKVAADLNAGAVDPNLDFEFTTEFFDSIEQEDPESVEKLAHFIDAARGQGMDDKEIEQTIDDLQKQASAVDPDADPAVDPDAATDDAADGDFEQKLAGAYMEGSESAVADYLQSEFAKQAGITEDSIVDYEVGRAKGFGYAETMNELREMGDKIAQVTAPGPDDAAAAITMLESQGFDVSNIKKQAGIGPTSAVSVARALMGKEAAEPAAEPEATDDEMPEEVKNAFTLLQEHGYQFEG